MTTPQTARTNDTWTGRCNVEDIDMDGIIIGGNPNRTLDDGRYVAQCGDLVRGDCGHEGYIVTCSESVKAGDLGVARVGDEIDGDVTGVITSGSENMLTGD